MNAFKTCLEALYQKLQTSLPFSKLRTLKPLTVPTESGKILMCKRDT